MSAHERITYRITIDAERCNGCNNCTTACPVNAALMKKKNFDPDERVIVIKNGVAVVVNPFRCDGGGICMIVCPEDCITIEFIPLSEYRDAEQEKTEV